MTRAFGDAVPALAVDGVTFRYDGVTVLNDVSFTVDRGNLVGVVGPNGAGKSTLFHSIVGLLAPQEGTIRIFGQPPDKARGVLAYVPQHERVNWRFPLNAYDVVLLGRSRKMGWLRRPGRMDHQITRESLQRVGLWDRRDDLVANLSGGQRQRVFVARALAQEAQVVVLDEAFSGVDVASQQALLSVLKGLRDEGKLVLLATHDLTRIAERFDLLVCLNRHICAFGPPAQVFTPAVLEELYGAHGLVVDTGIQSGKRSD